MVKQDQKKVPTMKAKSCYLRTEEKASSLQVRQLLREKREIIILISNLPVRKVTASPCGQSKGYGERLEILNSLINFYVGGNSNFLLIVPQILLLNFPKRQHHVSLNGLLLEEIVFTGRLLSRDGRAARRELSCPSCVALPLSRGDS